MCDCNSHQKLLPMHHKMKQILIILLTTMKATARKQPQPSKKYKAIPNSLDKIVVLLILKNTSGQQPQIHIAKMDSHLTFLGFTAANGISLMCSIIFAAKEMEESWVLGFDPSADLIGDENDVARNTVREEDIHWDQPAPSMATTCLPFAAAPKVEVSLRSCLCKC